MASKWMTGDGEFSPSKCAGSILSNLRPGASAEDREYVVGVWKYYAEFVRVTAHGDGNRPSPMADGTVCYWSWQAATSALFFMEAYSMAIAATDDSEGIENRDQARTEWREADWDAIYERIAADNRNYQKSAMAK